MDFDAFRRTPTRASVCFVAGAIFLCLAWIGTYRETVLKKEGLRAQATVVSLRQIDYRRSYRPKAHMYLATVEFTDSHGITQRTETRSILGSRSKLGKRVSVMYLPDNPQMVEILAIPETSGIGYDKVHEYNRFRSDASFFWWLAGFFFVLSLYNFTGLLERMLTSDKNPFRGVGYRRQRGRWRNNGPMDGIRSTSGTLPNRPRELYRDETGKPVDLIGDAECTSFKRLRP